MPRRSSRSGAGTGPGANGSGNGGSGSGSGQNGMGRIGAFFSDIADTLGLEDNSGGRGSGYDADKVCTQCLGMLQGMSAGWPRSCGRSRWSASRAEEVKEHG